MSTEQGFERRQELIVDRTFQMRFGFRLGATLLFFLAAWLLISLVAPMIASSWFGQPDWVAQDAVNMTWKSVWATFIPLVCTFFFLFAVTLKQTFRIAGPSYRFRMVCQDLKQLRIPRGVRIREGDYLQETAAEFNDALHTVHVRIAELKESGRIVSEALERAGANGSTIDHPTEMTAVRMEVARMKSLLDECTLVDVAPYDEPQPATTTDLAEEIESETGSTEEMIAATDREPDADCTTTPDPKPELARARAR